jgi:hypothetical protein
MTLADIITALKQPVPSSFISRKKVGSSELDYIAWFDYCDLLDERCGLGKWQWEITNVMTSENNKMIEGKLIPDNRLFITGKLTIFGDDANGTLRARTISQMATGTEILNCSSYGDPSSNAEAMALRRCCAKFGLARELWRKDNKTKFNNSPSNNSKPLGKREITRDEWLAMKANQG